MSPVSLTYQAATPLPENNNNIATVTTENILIPFVILLLTVLTILLWLALRWRAKKTRAQADLHTLRGLHNRHGNQYLHLLAEVKALRKKLNCYLACRDMDSDMGMNTNVDVDVDVDVDMGIGDVELFETKKQYQRYTNPFSPRRPRPSFLPLLPPTPPSSFSDYYNDSGRSRSRSSGGAMKKTVSEKKKKRGGGYSMLPGTPPNTPSPSGGSGGSGSERPVDSVRDRRGRRKRMSRLPSLPYIESASLQAELETAMDGDDEYSEEEDSGVEWAVRSGGGEGVGREQGGSGAEEEAGCENGYERDEEEEEEEAGERSICVARSVAYMRPRLIEGRGRRPKSESVDLLRHLPADLRWEEIKRW